jgi:hypothetical protein
LEHFAWHGVIEIHCMGSVVFTISLGTAWFIAFRLRLSAAKKNLSSAFAAFLVLILIHQNHDPIATTVTLNSITQSSP